MKPTITLAANLALGLAAALCLLLAAGPLLLPYRVFTVLSGSMAPAIPAGAEVAGWPAAPGAVRVGDVITFQPPDRPDGAYVTHRVVALDDTAAGARLRTRGDANGADDAWTLPAGRSYLRVFLSVPLAGYALEAISTPLAHVLLVAVLAASAVAYVVELFRRPASQ